MKSLHFLQALAYEAFMTTASTHTITDDEDGMRLDRLVNKRFSMPNALCQKSCRKGLIRLDGKRVEASSRVAFGQVLTFKVAFDANAEQPIAAKKIKKLTDREIELAHSMVLFKDKDIMILNKPPGLAVQGGSKLTQHIDALMPALQFDAKEQPRLVHRLDKDTSGVLLLARTIKAARELQHLFAQKAMHKTYLALVIGVPHPLENTIETMMIKAADEDTAFEKMESGDKGKKAVTYYKVRDYMAKTAALVEMNPITGRTHQLRVHMARIDCPIVGDRKYGLREGANHLNIDTRQLHLHAWKLEVPELFGKQPRIFEAPLPPVMQANLTSLGLLV